MPSSTERQRRFMGAVRSCQEGGRCSPEVKRAARSMTHEQVRDFTRKPARKGRRSRR